MEVKERMEGQTDDGKGIVCPLKLLIRKLFQLMVPHRDVAATYCSVCSLVTSCGKSEVMGLEGEYCNTPPPEVDLSFGQL